MLNKIFLFFFSFLALPILAQQINLPLNFEIQNRIEAVLLQKKQNNFTTVRPLLISDINRFINTDSVRYFYGRDKKLLSKMKHPMWWRKFRTESLIKIDHNDFHLRMNPLFNFNIGQENNIALLKTNTRGIDIYGDLGNKFSFRTGVYENQALFPSYYTNFIKKSYVVPGQGRARPFQDTAYDYGYSYGYLSWTPSSSFNFQIGHAKHFIGNGYRSLILSDNAYNSPFLKFTETWKNIRYTQLLMALQHSAIADSYALIAERRYASFSTLDFLIGENWELGITEAIIWKKRPYGQTYPNLNILNPIILWRTFQYGMEAENNVLLGFNSKIKITKKLLTYQQLIIDGQQKSGFQLGIKAYNLFLNNLFLQLEYNQVQPYVYAHWDKQNFTQYNQSLAHSLGANFKELIFRTHYQWKDFIFSYQINFVQQGLDNDTINYGADVFEKYIDYEGHSTLQGEKSKLLFQQFKLAYLINPVSNMQIFILYQNRKYNQEQSSFYWIGLATHLQNLYSDF